MDRREWLVTDDIQAMIDALLSHTHLGQVAFTISGKITLARRPSDRKFRLWIEACRAVADASDGQPYNWSDLDDSSALSRVLQCWCDPNLWLTREVPLFVRCQLLREIIGDPWNLTTLCGVTEGITRPEDCYTPHCPNCATILTPLVLQLATVAHDHQDWSVLGPLSDALEDAGCNCEPLLMHLRGRDTHCRGCWAIDCILGKS